MRAFDISFPLNPRSYFPQAAAAATTTTTTTTFVNHKIRPGRHVSNLLPGMYVYTYMCRAAKRDEEIGKQLHHQAMPSRMTEVGLFLDEAEILHTRHFK